MKGKTLKRLTTATLLVLASLLSPKRLNAFDFSPAVSYVRSEVAKNSKARADLRYSLWDVNEKANQKKVYGNREGLVGEAFLEAPIGNNFKIDDSQYFGKSTMSLNGFYVLSADAQLEARKESGKPVNLVARLGGGVRLPVSDRINLSSKLLLPVGNDRMNDKEGDVSILRTPSVIEVSSEIDFGKGYNLRTVADVEVNTYGASGWFRKDMSKQELRQRLNPSLTYGEIELSKTFKNKLFNQGMKVSFNPIVTGKSQSGTLDFRDKNKGMNFEYRVKAAINFKL